MGSRATACGSSGTGTVLSTRLSAVRIAATVSAPGFTDQTKRPSSETAIGLEVVPRLNTVGLRFFALRRAAAEATAGGRSARRATIGCLDIGCAPTTLTDVRFGCASHRAAYA